MAEMDLDTNEGLAKWLRSLGRGPADAAADALERALRVDEAVERLRRGILYSEDHSAIVAAFLEEVDRA